jgi:tetratricopeptide (TPR) repeat protein
MIRLFVLQIIIIFLFLPNNSIATNQDVFDDAKIYFKKKDYDQSKFLFQKFLVFNPKDYLSYLYLAKIFKEEDNKNETEKNLNTTLLLNPKNEEALFMLIELQLERSNFSKAKELNEKLSLICSKLCDNKNIITEKIKNLEPKKSTK